MNRNRNNTINNPKIRLNLYTISLLIFIVILIIWDIALRYINTTTSASTSNVVLPHNMNIDDLNNLVRDAKILLHDAAVANKSLSLSLSSNLNSNSKLLSSELVTDISRLNKDISGSSSSSSSCGSSSSNYNDKWLVIGINTVGRKGGIDYLLQTLTAIEHELSADVSDSLYGRILVVVANVHGKYHEMFYKAKQKYNNHPKSIYFKFIDKYELPLVVDPNPKKRDSGNANVPGHRVRKQTRDIVAVMRSITSSSSSSSNNNNNNNNNFSFKYYLFLEDDMLLCPSGFLAMQYMLKKASNYHPDWLALKTSYGMNGIFLREKDVLVFANYLEKHQARRPPDHLVVEWFARETKEASTYAKSRINVAFKYNIFDHVGSSSSLRNQMQSTFPGCYEMLLEPVNFKVEAFSLRDCPHDDIWPCNIDSSSSSSGSSSSSSSSSSGSGSSSSRLEHHLLRWPSLMHSRNGGK